MAWIQGNYLEAVNLIDEYSDDEFSIEFKFEEIDALVMRREYEKADILINSLNTNPELSKVVSRFKSRKFVLDFILGRKSYFEGRKSEMKHYIDKIDEYEEDLQIDDYLYYWKSFFLVLKGTYNLSTNNIETALCLYLEAELLLKPYEDKFYSAKFILIGIYYNVSAIDKLKDKFEEAIEWLEKGRKIGLENNIPWMLGHVYSNLEVIHSELGHYDKAIEYFNESLTFQSHTNSPPMFQSFFNFRLFHLHMLIDNENEANEIKLRISKLLDENPDDIFYSQTGRLMTAMQIMRQNR